MDKELAIIGTIHSDIKDIASAPKMESEAGAVRARIVMDPAYAEAMDGLKPGARLELFTWFHKSDRTVLTVHPRGIKENPRRGVFSTRSPARPNPIGLHRVTLVAIEAPLTLVVEPLEAIDGTPVIDIKPQPGESSRMDRFEAVETTGGNQVGGWVRTTDGVRLWVEIRGTGRPVILLHGWTMSSLFWRRQAQLADACQVVTVDFRSHGRSQATPRGRNVPRYALDVREAISALGLDRALLLGWSMGGSVALEYWQRFGSDRLAGLGTVETGPYPMSPAPWNVHKCHGHNEEAMRKDLSAMKADRRGFAARFVNAMFLSGQAPEHALKWMVAEQLKAGPDAAAAIYEDYARRDYTPALPSVNIPALVLYGRSLHICYGPSAGRFVAASLPDSRFVILDKSGHMPFYEQPEEFNRTVSGFLNTLDA